jgi:HlyD family secretion protein
MKKGSKIILGIVGLGVVGASVALATRGRGDKDQVNTLVKIEKGTIVEKALAVGQIVPDQEIQVKSQISGRIKDTFVEVGDQVVIGQPLFSVSPDPTPLELAEADRRVQLAENSYKKAEMDLERHRSLWSNGIVAKDGFDQKERDFDQARIQLAQERDKLALLKDGKIARAASAGGVDSVIRASSSGTVLERLVNPGDPVVPLTTFQAGTVLMTLADMKTLEFRGTVDEIDVGKMADGLPVRIQIGALPGQAIQGKLTRIAPKAKTKDGATLFDVEAAIENTNGVTLRAGFSANADVIIREKKDVILVAERLVTREKDKTFVEVPGATPEAEPVKKEITTGLSDGLNVEVLSGLAEGEQVVQRPPKQIT